MPIQVYVDESGGKGQGKDFVLAGLWASARSWARFSSKWDKCLKTSPRIEYFKMAEAANLDGEFRFWSAEDRDQKLKKLAKIINRYVDYRVYQSIDIQSHSLTFAHLPKPKNELYFWMYQCTILGASADLYLLGQREPFEIIFDEQVIFGPRARAWYPLIRDIAATVEPAYHALLPVDPLFKDDREMLPLQAADLFAWLKRHRTADPSNTDFNWVLSLFPEVRVASSSRHYGLATLLQYIAFTENNPKYRATYDMLIERHRDALGRWL